MFIKIRKNCKVGIICFSKSEKILDIAPAVANQLINAGNAVVISDATPEVKVEKKEYSWDELREIAKEKKINSFGVKKEDLINLLNLN